MQQRNKEKQDAKRQKGDYDDEEWACKPETKRHPYPQKKSKKLQRW